MPAPLSDVEIEMATGLSLDDIEALENDSGEETRADIAAKFARQYDQLNRGEARKITGDLLKLFSKDASKKVRRRFAEEISSSRHLKPDVAVLLARDALDIATPVLEKSGALSDTDLAAIVKDMPEAYALAIAGREPLSEIIADLLIEHRGTNRIISRLVDNSQAALSQTALEWIFDWAQSHPELSEQLKQRPNLPFAVTEKHVAALGQELEWTAIAKQSMSKDEAIRMQGLIANSASHQPSRSVKRQRQTFKGLKTRYETGDLKPADIIGFLRDQNIPLVESSFAVTANVDLKRVRNLLYGSDKRGLVALCLKAGFATSEYLAFRMALGLVEIGNITDDPNVTYCSTTTRFAQAQFEEMRAQPEQIDAWIGKRRNIAAM